MSEFIPREEWELIASRAWADEPNEYRVSGAQGDGQVNAHRIADCVWEIFDQPEMAWLSPTAVADMIPAVELRIAEAFVKAGLSVDGAYLARIMIAKYQIRFGVGGVWQKPTVCAHPQSIN